MNTDQMIMFDILYLISRSTLRLKEFILNLDLKFFYAKEN
jgi:hypothetical protein